MQSCTSLIDLDHPMMRVRDLAAARNAYQRLGFTLTPYRTNNPFGGGTTGGNGGNHLVMLTPLAPRTTNMIELAYCDRDFAWPTFKELLSGPEGLAMLVHSPTDAERIREEWQSAGIACDPVFEVRTDFTDPETGRRDLIHFRVAQPSRRDWIYTFGAAQIMDFAHYLREDWRTHENGARHWTQITLLPPPAQMAAGRAHLRKVYGVEPESAPNGGIEVRILNLTLRLVPNDRGAEVYPGIPLQTADAPSCHTALTVKVASLAQLHSVLARNGVQSFALGRSLCVAPRDACGVLMEFTEA